MIEWSNVRASAAAAAGQAGRRTPHTSLVERIGALRALSDDERQFRALLPHACASQRDHTGLTRPVPPPECP